MAARHVFQIGDKVVWSMYDGHLMAGTVTAADHDHGFGQWLSVRRVDGGHCRLEGKNARPATDADVLAACKWFQTLGRE